MTGTVVLNTPANASSSAPTARYVAATVNNARASHGIRRLWARSDLNYIAYQQAIRMARAHTIFHNPYLASQARNWVRLAENVGTGSSAGQIALAFMRSPGHRANILGSWSDMGVGIATSGGRYYVVEVFRQRG
ncbi:MAG: hypothetical protein QOG53_1591 [Frankiales bacterium]|nr:hypothetical protein [Frankiales bacterium]